MYGLSFSFPRQPCRIKYMYTESGEKVRVSNRSGRIVPWPAESKDLSRIANPGMLPGLRDTLSVISMFKLQN